MFYEHHSQLPLLTTWNLYFSEICRSVLHIQFRLFMHRLYSCTKKLLLNFQTKLPWEMQLNQEWQFLNLTLEKWVGMDKLWTDWMWLIWIASVLLNLSLENFSDICQSWTSDEWSIRKTSLWFLCFISCDILTSLIQLFIVIFWQVRAWIIYHCGTFKKR